MPQHIFFFRGLHEDELKVHIDKLHEYNEIKDVAQMVLGRIGKEIVMSLSRYVFGHVTAVLLVSYLTVGWSQLIIFKRVLLDLIEIIV